MTTPAAMTVSFSDLQTAIGRTFIVVRTGWTSDQTNDINDCIRDGLNEVYSAYRWSFLRPRISITTVASPATFAYDLPAACDTIEDDALTYPTGQGWEYRKVLIVPEVDLREMRARCDRVGRPEVAALVTQTFDPTAGSKRQIELYPTPDAVYTLTGTCHLRPVMLDATNQYPIGGELLAPVFKEAVLAAAERFLDEQMGVHNAQFQKLLAAAIAEDKDRASPSQLGRSRGGEDGFEELGFYSRIGELTFEGFDPL